MNTSCRSLLGLTVLVIVSALGATEAFGREYSSPKGYKIQVPPGWKTADADTRDNLRHFVRQEFSNLRSADLDTVDVLLFEDSPKDFLANMNVVVSKGVVPVSKSELSEAANEILSVYRSVGITPRDFTSSIGRVADRDCYVFSYTARMFGQNIRQTQYAVPGKDVTYIVTCSAAVEDQARYQPVFARAMDSFQVTGSGLGFWNRLPGPLRWAIIGGGIGLAWSVLGGLFKGKTSSNEPEKTPAAPETDTTAG